MHVQKVGDQTANDHLGRYIWGESADDNRLHYAERAEGKTERVEMCRPSVFVVPGALSGSAWFAHAFSASTPGNGLPSIHSRNAPPAVLTNVKSAATPA